MDMKRTLFLTLLMPASICFAQQGEMATADTNNDGKVNAAELKAYVSTRLPGFDRFDALFKAIDRNGDGSVDAGEFAGRMQAMDTVTKEPQTSVKPEPVEFVDRFEKMFAGRRPKLGDTIDEGLSAYDASGKPFSFASTRGKHAVIVFGCLT